MTPLLATYSFLPITSANAATGRGAFETRDTSLAGWVIAGLPEYLNADQRIGDALAELRAMLGIEPIPERWLVPLALRSVIEQVAADLHVHAGGAVVERSDD